MKKYILSALLFMAAGLQTAWAQKVLIYKTDSTTIEIETSEVDSMVFVSPEPIPSYLTCPDDNHPHAIDLGLPSGTKWCCCNVGASKPREYGGFYAWGETWEKDNYAETTYSYYNGQDTNGDGQIDENFSIVYIGANIAGTHYDVAHVCMGPIWRMPTKAQMDELRSKCSMRSESHIGVHLTGPNGGHIFLPYTGYQSGGCLWTLCNGYWTSELSYRGAEIWDFNQYIKGPHNSNRHYGFPVRAVCQ